MFMRKLRDIPRNFLRQDAAESSIMTVMAQNVGAILLLPVMAVVTLLVIGGGNIIAESNVQSEIKVANEAFTSDIERATLIRPVSQTMVVALSDRYDKAAGTRVENAATADRAGITTPAANRTCRISIWSISAPVNGKSSIKNTVAWDDNLASCTTAGKTIAQLQAIATGAGATDVSVPVPLADTNSAITYTNAAGRPLSFSSGSEIGAPSGTTTDPDGWFSPAEWANAAIKTVKLGLQTQLNVSGQNNISFIANTNEVIAAIDAPPGVVLPPPVAKLWVPNPVTDIVPQRCKTGPAGVVDPGGFGNLECIDVTWTVRPASECDTSQTLKYTIIVTNKITGKQVILPQTALTTGQAKVLGIWNGNSYDVTVTARCVDGGPEVESTPSTVPFDQLLPTPRINLAYGATEDQHIVTWAATSSDPDINYELGYQAYNGALTYTKQTETGPLPNWHWLPANGSGTWANVPLGTPNATTVTTSGNVIAAGFPDSYRIRASVPIPPATDKTQRIRSIWGYASIIYIIKLSSAPGVTVGVDGAGNVTTTAIGAAATLCPAGVSSQWAFETHRGKNGTPVSSWNSLLVSPWAAAASKSEYMDEGGIYLGRSVLSCYTAYVPLPDAPNLLKTDAYNKNITNDADGAIDTASINRFNETLGAQQPNSAGRQNNTGISRWGWVVRPITTPAVPSGLYASVLSVGNGGQSTTNWNNAGCAAGTTQIFNHQFVGVNNGGYAGIYTNNWPTGNSINQVHNEANGTRYDWRVAANCQSNLPGWDLPIGVPVAQAAAWSGFATSWFVTDVVAPSASSWSTPTSVNTNAGYNTYASYACAPGNSSPSYTGAVYESTSGIPYGGGHWDYPSSRSGYCEGTWRGTGYKDSASVTTTPGRVWVTDPPWPAPGSPSALGVVGSQARYCTGGFDVTVRWSGGSYTDGYNVILHYLNNNNTTDVISTSTTGTVSYFSVAGPLIAYAQSFEVQAYGPGGKSGWISGPTPVAGCIN